MHASTVNDVKESLPLRLAECHISCHSSHSLLSPSCHNPSVHPFYEFHPFPSRAMADLSRKALWSSLRAQDGFPATVSFLFSCRRIIFATRRTVGRAELRGTAAALHRADKLFTEGITRRTMMFAVNDSGLDDNELCEIFIFPYRLAQHCRRILNRVHRALRSDRSIYSALITTNDNSDRNIIM